MTMNIKKLKDKDGYFLPVTSAESVFITPTKTLKEYLSLTQSDTYTDQTLGLKNARSPIYIATSDGFDELIHPKILYFKNGWNGYQYWLCASPYPKSNDAYENPCVYRSNDLINWVGISANPLDTVTGNTHNADPHLVYREDINTLEIWWMNRNKTNEHRDIYRRTTTDGINWTAKQIVFSTDNYYTASPVINFENGVYKFSFLNPSFQHECYTSDTGKKDTWTLIGKYNITIKNNANNDWKAWHYDIVNVNGCYECILCCYYGTDQSYCRLYTAKSIDGYNFENFELILDKSSYGWDNKLIYRASFIFIDGLYYMMYSACNTSSKWRIGLLYGYSLKKLNEFPFSIRLPLSSTDSAKLNNGNFSNEVCYTNEGIVRVYFSSIANTTSTKINNGAPICKLPKFFEPSKQFGFAASIQKTYGGSDFTAGWGVCGLENNNGNLVLKVYADNIDFFQAAGSFDYII